MKYNLQNKLLMTTLMAISINTTGQNLIANSAFDSNIDNWSNGKVNETWVANDGAPTSGNGSLKFQSNVNNGGSIWMESDFMPVEENYKYILGASFKQPADSLANYLLMTVKWYDENNNFIGEYPYLGLGPVFDVSSTDTWLNYDSTYDSIIAGTKKAKVILWIGTPSEGTGLSYALFDDIIFFQDTVFKSDFE